ncbi:hypothetical protein K501DRAFT_265280 [Backusella circina FSU 941]|nr:hypothetical protein K501DRAFT_265280 [Backusella circina FSU 941]
MITLGQASCIVLDLALTTENRQIAKQQIKESLFGVTYLHEKGPSEPMVMGKSIISKNPFKYLSYPDTPPGSPNNKDTSELEVSRIHSPNESSDTEVLSYQYPYSQEDTLYMAKILFSMSPEKDIEFYQYTFVPTKRMYKIMQKMMPKLENIFTRRQFAYALSKNTSIFGPLQFMKSSFFFDNTHSPYLGRIPGSFSRNPKSRQKTVSRIWEKVL